MFICEMIDLEDFYCYGIDGDPFVVVGSMKMLLLHVEFDCCGID